MAENANVNKVVYGESTLIDLTDDDVTASDVVQGKTFHMASGLRTTGTALYAGSAEAGGNAVVSNGILYGSVDANSTATAFTASVPGLDSLYNGAVVVLKNGVVTSAAGFTINVNNLGAKPVYTNLAAATAETTKFNVNYTLMFVYDSTRVEGGCWLCYNGYDSNTNTIGYQLRTNSVTLTASDKGYRYRLWFTSADGTKWVPANTSTSTNATASRTPNTRPIDPFGPIVYNSTNGTTNAAANLANATLWQQYTLALGYSFNATGTTLALTYPAPVYLKCLPQSDGSAVMQGCVQALPSTNDGYIYIFLGLAYSETAIELRAEHSVYCHDFAGIRIWTGSTSGGDTVVPSASTTVPSMDGTASYGSGTTWARADHVHPSDTSRAEASHSHGSITNAGAITSDTSVASGDKLVISDASDSSKLKRSGVSFGSSTTTYLRNDGTWARPGDWTDISFDFTFTPGANMYFPMEFKAYTNGRLVLMWFSGFAADSDWYLEAADYAPIDPMVLPGVGNGGGIIIDGIMVDESAGGVLIYPQLTCAPLGLIIYPRSNWHSGGVIVPE